MITREEARKAAEVMLAYANGKEIEMRDRERDHWMQGETVNFNWGVFDYRIKPKQEKFDPKTLQPFDKVLVRNNDNEKWICTLFSYIINGKPFSYMCIYTSYKMAIPYNDDTKHLVGTTDEAPEFYRYWEE